MGQDAPYLYFVGCSTLALVEKLYNYQHGENNTRYKV